MAHITYIHIYIYIYARSLIILIYVPWFASYSYTICSLVILSIDGEYELGFNDVEEEFAKILDEMVFGPPEEASVKIERSDSPALAPHPISGDIAAEIKSEKDPDLPSLEERMRRRLTKRKCQEIVIQKNIKEEFEELENERKVAESERRSQEKELKAEGTL